MYAEPDKAFSSKMVERFSIVLTVRALESWLSCRAVSQEIFPRALSFLGDARSVLTGADEQESCARIRMTRPEHMLIGKIGYLCNEPESWGRRMELRASGEGTPASKRESAATSPVPRSRVGDRADARHGPRNPESRLPGVDARRSAAAPVFRRREH